MNGYAYQKPRRFRVFWFRLKRFALFSLVLLLNGCLAGQGALKQGDLALEQQNYDLAVKEYLKAAQEHPGNNEYLLRLNRTMAMAALQHQARGDELMAEKKFRRAMDEYMQALELDGSLYVAANGLEAAKRSLELETLLAEARQLMANDQNLAALERIDRALALDPDHLPARQLKQHLIRLRNKTLVDGIELAVSSPDPITLNFKDTELPDAFDILTRLSGINFILDEDIQKSKTSLFIEEASFSQALELLLRMNKLDKKILNSKTIILYPKTREKQKQFQDQIIRTFYLSHIDAKKAVNLLRTMLQIRKIYVQEELNAVVIRDEPEVVRLAQKMLEANDRGSSEVLFDLELIEVNHSDTEELGLKLSNYSIGAGLSIDGTGTIVDSALSSGNSTANLADFKTGLDPFYALPTATFRLLKTQVDADILANPSIRVRNQEKAKVHVGSREPIITVTTTGDNVSDSVQYVDIGVKLNVEPTIQLDNTIVTKLSLEVSNVSGREKTTRGTAVITISSTNAETVLTLKDGEQTIIGGLIRNDNSVTNSKIPLLGDLPLLSKLVNGRDNVKSKREILLSITPHILKTVHVPTGDTAAIWSGGEEDFKFGRNFGTFAEDYRIAQELEAPPLDDQPETEAEPATGQDEGRHQD